MFLHTTSNQLLLLYLLQYCYTQMTLVVTDPRSGVNLTYGVHHLHACQNMMLGKSVTYFSSVAQI